jgi:hypothetical protein
MPGAVSAVSDLAADAGHQSMVHGNAEACVAAGVGFIASGAPVAVATGVVGGVTASGATAIAVPAGGLSLLADAVDALAGSPASKESCG